jgi:hypothetical protein
MPKRFFVIFAIFLALFISNSIPCADTLVPASKAQVFAVGAQRAPSLAIDRNDTIYLMMSAATKPASEHTPGSQVFFTQSTDFGASWDNFPKTRNLSNSNGEAFGPVISIAKVGKPKIYAVYHDTIPGPTQVFLLRTKKGVKFRAPKNITPHDGGAFVPRIAVDSAENLNIVWGDTLTGRRVVYTRSTDLGDSFSPLLDISRSTGFAFEPEIALDPQNNIYVVWEDDASGSKAIMFTRSTNGGTSFSTPAQLSQGSGNALESHISTDASGRIYVSWSQEIDGAVQAFFTRSTNQGATFSTPINLSNAANGDVRKTCIATFQNTVYVAYNNDDGRDHQAYILMSTDAGQTFGEPVQISDASRNKGRAHSVAMVVDSHGTLHTVWIDSSLLGNDEGLLFYSKTSNGRNFSKATQVLAFITL